jgi:hypothetical protein|tara:strand:+ start:203 stop:367 length:165 start_codon:yes stop_codon:yes gene_type:complete
LYNGHVDVEGTPLICLPIFALSTSFKAMERGPTLIKESGCCITLWPESYGASED